MLKISWQNSRLRVLTENFCYWQIQVLCFVLAETFLRRLYSESLLLCFVSRKRNKKDD